MILSRLPTQKLFQKFEAVVLALLRVKLRRKNILFSDRRGHRPAVITGRLDNRLIIALDEVRMDEVEIGRLGEGFEDRTSGPIADLIPSNLRNTERRR